MFKNSKKNPSRTPTSKIEPIIPDPWKTTEPEPHFPSPLELDRLLREPHPLINATKDLLEISPAGIPGIELLPAHSSISEINPIEVLLKNELKLPASVETFKAQIEKALVLLYWLATKPEQLFA